VEGGEELDTDTLTEALLEEAEAIVGAEWLRLGRAARQTLAAPARVANTAISSGEQIRCPVPERVVKGVR
jgi:hypothetical protein